MLVFNGMSLPSFNSWAVPAAGLLAAAMLFLVGRTLLGLHRSRQVPVEEPEPVVQHDPFVQGSTTERRTSVRRGGKLVEVFITDAHLREEPISGWVVDRSVSGLGLHLTQPFEVGTILNVRPQQGGSSVPWTQVEVKRCIKEGKFWKVGVRFVRTPPWSVLLMFG